MRMDLDLVFIVLGSGGLEHSTESAETVQCLTYLLLGLPVLVSVDKRWRTSS